MSIRWTAFLALLVGCVSPAFAATEIPKIVVDEGGTPDFKLLVHCSSQEKSDGVVIGAFSPEVYEGPDEIRTFDSGNVLNGKQFTYFFRRDDIVGFVVSEPQVQNKENEIFLLINLEARLPRTEMNFVGLLFGGDLKDIPLFCVLVSTNLENEDLEGFFEEAKKQ